MAAAVTESRIKSREGTFRIQNENSGTLIFNVNTDSDATVKEVYTGSLIATPHPVPALYSLIESNAYALGITVRQRQKDNFTKWTVQVTYGQLPDGSNPNNSDPTIDDDPLKRKAVRYVQHYTVEERIDHQADGVPMVNTAGEIFPEPIHIELERVIYVIEKNYSTLNAVISLNETYEGSQNSDNVDPKDGVSTPATPLGAGTLKYMGTTTGPPRFENGVQYWTGITRCAYQANGWIIEKTSEGYREKFTIGQNDYLVNILDQNGQQGQVPHKLNVNGGAITEDNPGTPHIHYFDPLAKVAFQPLFNDPPVI